MEPPKEPLPLSYASPPARVSWVPKFNGWWVVLASLPVFLFWWLPSTRSTSSFSGNPEHTAVTWASLAIGVRAVVGIIRRERNWAWVVYLPLYFVLPIVAGAAASYAFRYGWGR